MIDLKDFKKNTDRYLLSLSKRLKEPEKLYQFGGLVKEHVKGHSDLKKLLKEHSELEKQAQQILTDKNTASELISKSKGEDKLRLIASMRDLDEKRTHVLDSFKVVDDSINEIVALFPNPPREDVPVGADESSNAVVREVGSRPNLTNPKEYLEIAETLGLIDVKRASKVSGSRFGYLLGPIAQMEFALVQYAQSVLLKRGFTMVVPPVMIKEENMAAMGYLNGGGEDETYHFEKDHLYLVGTSEQSVGPMHRDEVFAEENLPRRYLSFSTCFRREAGSYGKDTKGIIRVHQFDKLEMFSFTTPEQSDAEHEFLLSIEEQLMQGLELPYRVMKLCTGDLGWPSARTYDIETWMPGQGVYRETHSTSNTTDYQSRALNIKFSRGGKKEYVHMLNGTAFAIGRTLIGIIENYQQPDGSIAVPAVLQPYMGGLTVITK